MGSVACHVMAVAGPGNVFLTVKLYRLMKKLLLLFAAMFIGTVSLFAEEKVVTITGEDALWTTNAGAQSKDKDGVTIATSNGVFNANSSQYRAYASSTFTVSVSEGTITGIEFTCAVSGTAKGGPGNFVDCTIGDYAYEDKAGTWTGTASSVSWSAQAQVQMTSIVVTYETGNVTPAPEATALSLAEATPVKTEYRVGEAFCTEGLVATATFSDESTKDVTESVKWTCEPAVIAADTKSVTVTASYNGLTASKNFDVTVVVVEGEQTVVITGEDKLWATSRDGQSGSKGGVTIATTDGILGTYSNVGQYRAYKGSTFTVSVAEGNITSIEFTCQAADDAQYGPGCYNSWSTGDYAYAEKIGTWTGNAETVSFVAGLNQVRMQTIKVTYVVGENVPEATALELAEATPVQTDYYVGDAFSTKGLTAIATFSDESTKDVTDAASWTCEPSVIAEDTKTVIVTATYKGLTASKTYDVSVKSIANTPETAYTVEEAVALIEAGNGLSVNVYIKGIISKVESFNEKYGSITYYISTDGTESSQQFMCYSGLNIGGEKFTSIDDLEVGSTVVVMGVMKKYGDIYEFNYNNEIVSLVSVGVDGIAAENVAVAGKVMENGRVVVLKAGKKYTVAGQRIK